MEKLDGSMFIGGERSVGREGTVHSVAAATGEALEPGFGMGGPADVERAAELAELASDAYRRTAPETRALFLEAIADEIINLGDQLIERAMLETGLPRARLEGERGRTVGQLRLFASVVREGSWMEARIDPAMPDRAPAPRADLRLQKIALGPVAVFGASNFPLAFSVAGGDTASALAAGCPVIVKAHSAHLGTSALVAEAIHRACTIHKMPAGVFSMLIGSGATLGAALVADRRIQAVGFTGSRNGGLALMKVASARPAPIPVYAEMSSINPVILFPNALHRRAGHIGRQFAASLTLGAGQFCTNPGLIIAVDGPDLDHFISEVASALSEIPASTMLTPSIHQAYQHSLECHQSTARVVAEGPKAVGMYEAESKIFSCAAKEFFADRSLHEEMFGPAALVVRCPDLATVREIIAGLDGQLTVALHMEAEDYDAAASLLPLLERKAGRILANGFGTGVEVSHAMVHGGPFPATSDGRSTSVGSLAIDRFVRPVCYQDLPQELLPTAVGDQNEWSVPQRVDGVMLRG